MVDLKLYIKRLGRRAMFFSARWLVRLLGFDRLRPAGRFIGDLQYFLQVFNRPRCRADMAVVLGSDAGDPQLARTLRSAYRVNTVSALEVVSMVDRKIDSGRLHERCRVEGLDNLEAARTGQGAILLATHACNSLLLLAQLTARGWPVTLVYRQSPNVPREFIEGGLRHYGFDGIAAEAGFKAFAGMIDAVRRDGLVFAMMDHGVSKAETGVQQRFLGKDMPMPGGIVQLARQTRAPIVPIRSLAIDPVWHFQIEPRLQLLPGASFEEDMAQVLGHVERQILAHPELWSWPHRRWRKYPIARA